MYKLAIKMLMGDRAKYLGLILGISFTAFLVTFAMSYFAGFMTRGFSLISENSAADVWVMDPAVNSVEQTIDMPLENLARIRSIQGVQSAVPLLLGEVNVRLANGAFQKVQVIGVDDDTLVGAPRLQDGRLPAVLRVPQTVLVDPGGTSGKWVTPQRRKDQWPHDGPHLDVPLRPIKAGDELWSNGQRWRVVGRSNTIPRFPPRPLLYTRYSNAVQLLAEARGQTTFIMVYKQQGVSAKQLAVDIGKATGLRARTEKQFKRDTVRWYLINSEDVGDMGAMLILAMTVGFGVTGIMLYMFSYENLKQYAVLKAMGARDRLLRRMVLVQAGSCAAIGSGIGVGVCAMVGVLVRGADFPFRMMWFAPLLGFTGVVIVSLTAALISIRPVLRLEPGIVFAGR